MVIYRAIDGGKLKYWHKYEGADIAASDNNPSQGWIGDRICHQDIQGNRWQEVSEPTFKQQYFIDKNFLSGKKLELKPALDSAMDLTWKSFDRMLQACLTREWLQRTSLARLQSVQLARRLASTSAYM